MTSKSTSKLTKLLYTAGTLDDTKESLGSQMLAFLREKNCTTLDLANEQFGISYDENRWSRTAGRPKDGSLLTSAPPTAKNYVTSFRRAYKAGLDVLSFKSMGKMRQAIRDLRDADREGQPKPPELRGVQVKKVDVINGALWHDLVVVWEHLPEEERGSLETKLERLLSQFIKKAPLTMAAAA